MVADVREAAPDARPPAEKPEREAARSPAADLVLTCPGFDNAVRWRPGERLEQLFERRCDWLHLVGWDNHLAVDALDLTLSYAELDGLANQLARFLVRRHGVRPGDRIGLLSDRAVDGYVGMLAVLKARAAYVPLDAAFPPDRLAYIASDAGVRLVLSRSHLAERIGDAATVLCLDQIQDQVGAQSTDRLGPDEAGQPVSNLCYVIYTSGSTGRPKGVAIQHASICNFIRVADEVYGITCKDRVYQGMTIAFDFSVEEIWVPWMAGATLVPKPDGDRVLGRELHAFLRDRRVTAMCCVPTLLATLDKDLPRLRFLLVSGEPCPQDLVTRWHRPGRRFLNVYGPTEATVTATWTLVHPGRPVTIGVPLPSYSVVVLDPDADVALPRGAMGEIGIAGIGLAKGYLNRSDLTGRVFIRDFLDIPNNPSGLIYRTGDLGRVNADGAIEHHGRIDTQVKIRGYRIELTEIESVLLRVPGIAQAVVSTHQPAPDVTELAAYYSLRPGAAPVDAGRVLAQLRERLPRYMVPAYLDELPVIPMLPSGKADRKSLPAPRGPRVVATAGQHAAPVTGAERALAEELAKVLDTGNISVDGHFFDELGASSLLMARFSAAIRERGDLPPVSMKEIYLHPTVRQLAAAVTGPLPAVGQGPAPRELPAAPKPAPASKSKPRFWLCGTLQLLAFLAYVAGFSLAVDAGAAWAAEASGALGLYERLVVFGGGGLLAMGILPVIAKWLLIGRWKPRRIRVWSLAYFRFWLVKTMIVANPLARVVVGTPLYTLYFRMLGARIGRRTVIFTTHAPVCTDLVTVGAGTVIGKDVHVTGYHARAGVIETGPVTLGRDVFVGQHTVIDIHAAMGDGAQIGHASALLPGQSVPAGECWHGSPAVPAEADCDYRTVAPARCGALRRTWYSLTRLVLLLAVVGPVSAAVASLLVSRPSLAERGLARLHIGMIDLGTRLRFGRFDLGRLDLGRATLGRVEITNWIFYVEVLAVAGVVFLVAILAGLIFVGTVPRLLSPLLRPGRVYPLYGLHHGLQRFISRSTNIAFFNNLFGDTSAVVRYLGLVGYRLKPVEQTGSNFGMEVRHEVPRLSVVGQGTMVSDGLTMVNAEFSSTSFRVVPTVIGARNFLGNGIVYPAGGRTGDDCLLATKVMIPVAGPVREGVGLLGSPCFEIPRSVQRDHRFDHLNIARRRRRQLKAKNRHNAATAGLHLLVRWLYLTGLALVALLPLGAGAWFPLRGDLVLRLPGLRGGTLTLHGDLLADALVSAASIVIMLVLTVGYFALVERAVTRFRRLQPSFCSVYEPPFWRHERFWKVPSIAYIQMFSGTPFKSVVWRLLGVQVGRRVFDDGCSIVERTLVQIGGEATLNAGSILQGHSLEGGAFKSGPIVVGARCTIGTGAFVHYSVTMGDGAVLEADSFLMKGEHLAPGSRWLGNPAANASVRRPASRRPAAPPRGPGSKPRPPAAAPRPPAPERQRPGPERQRPGPEGHRPSPEPRRPSPERQRPAAEPRRPGAQSRPVGPTSRPRQQPDPKPQPQRAGGAAVPQPDPLTAPHWPPPDVGPASLDARPAPPAGARSPARPEPTPPDAKPAPKGDSAPLAARPAPPAAGPVRAGGPPSPARLEPVPPEAKPAPDANSAPRDTGPAPPGGARSPARPEPAPLRERLDPLTAPHWPSEDPPDPPRRPGPPRAPREEPPASLRQEADLEPLPDPGR